MAPKHGKMNANICLYLSHFAAKVEVTRDARIPRGGDIKKNPMKIFVVPTVFNVSHCRQAGNNNSEQTMLPR